jgi:hypothetical protein
MWRADDVFHSEERMVRVAQRLLLEDVNRGRSRPAGPKRGNQRTRLDELSAAGNDQ